MKARRRSRHGKRYHLDNGLTAFRWNGCDVRAYVPPRGFTATADLIEHHPVTGTFLGESQWWMFLAQKVD